MRKRGLLRRYAGETPGGWIITSVAILEHDRLVADAFAVALRAEGFTVAVVTSLWADLVADPAMPVDVAIVDLHLGDGVLGATRVHDLTAMGAASVLLGTPTDALAVAAAFRAGALGFVARSDSLARLVAAVWAAAAGRQHLDVALEEAPVEPGLGRQEERALVLYATGRSIREVASDMRTTEETVKSYIKRGRRKYREAGVDVGTRVLLRAHASRQGWLTHR